MAILEYRLNISNLKIWSPKCSQIQKFESWPDITVENSTSVQRHKRNVWYKVQMKYKYMLWLNVDPISKLPCEVCASIPNSEMSSPLLVSSRAIGILNLFYDMTLSMGFVHALCRQIAELFYVPSVGCVCSSPSAFMMPFVSVSLQPLP